MSENQPLIAPQTARDLKLIRGESSGSGEPTSPRHRRRWLAVAVVLVCVGAAALAARQRILAPPAVDVVAVTLREIGLPEITLSATGYLVPRRQITVSSKTQGKIVEMPVAENEHVEADALLARIENDEQQASFRLAEAQFGESRASYERARQLHELGAVATAELDRARASYQVAEARLDLARVALDRTVVRAPIAGTVIRKLRDVGEFVTIGVTAGGDPGTALVTLADLSAMEVALDVNETEIQGISLRGVAVVAPEALHDRRYLADVIEVAAMADRQKGMVPVKLRLRQPDADLMPEMTARVSFLMSEPDGDIEVMRTLPSSAIVEREGRQVVFVLDGDRAVAEPVRARAVGADYVALEAGPETGTYVVADPPADLQSGGGVLIQSP